MEVQVVDKTSLPCHALFRARLALRTLMEPTQSKSYEALSEMDTRFDLDFSYSRWLKPFSLSLLWCCHFYNSRFCCETGLKTNFAYYLTPQNCLTDENCLLFAESTTPRTSCSTRECIEVTLTRPWSSLRAPATIPWLWKSVRPRKLRVCAAVHSNQQR